MNDLSWISVLKSDHSLQTEKKTQNNTFSYSKMTSFTVTNSLPRSNYRKNWLLQRSISFLARHVASISWYISVERSTETWNSCVGLTYALDMHKDMVQNKFSIVLSKHHIFNDYTLLLPVCLLRYQLVTSVHTKFSQSVLCL